MDALAAQIDTTLGAVIKNLQVDGRLVPNPTPPCIDIYPGDPFIERIAFSGEYAGYFTVRVRVSTADQEAGKASCCR